jgi:hypothetical protein
MWRKDKRVLHAAACVGIRAGQASSSQWQARAFDRQTGQWHSVALSDEKMSRVKSEKRRIPLITRAR